jgi:hypothetical protein
VVSLRVRRGVLTEEIESKETQDPEGVVENTGPVVLTERDIAVMQFAHEQRYLCYNQISDTFWKGCSEDAKACKHRVAKLVTAGFLSKQYSGRKKVDVYFATAKAVEALKARSLDSGIPALKFSRDFEQYISHDLHVTNLRMLFRELGWREWTSERVLRERDHYYHRPDGVLTVRGQKIAIEFENRITKGKARYAAMFDYYDKHAGYNLLFVIILKDIREWLLDLKYDARKVWFANYEDLMEQKGKAQFENMRASFELSRLL